MVEEKLDRLVPIKYTWLGTHLVKCSKSEYIYNVQNNFDTYRIDFKY